MPSMWKDVYTVAIASEEGLRKTLLACVPWNITKKARERCGMQECHFYRKALCGMRRSVPYKIRKIVQGMYNQKGRDNITASSSI